MKKHSTPSKQPHARIAALTGERLAAATGGGIVQNLAPGGGGVIIVQNLTPGNGGVIIVQNLAPGGGVIIVQN